MLKKTLFAAASAIAVVASASSPASAVSTTCPPGEKLNNDPFAPTCEPIIVRVPEPSSMLGIAVVGGFISKKVIDAKKASK